MNTFKKELELIANEFLENNGVKPNFSNRDFMNAILIFQTALLDKMWDNQNYDKMDINDREIMAHQCGTELRKLIHTYTGLDTHKIELFL